MARVRVVSIRAGGVGSWGSVVSRRGLLPPTVRAAARCLSCVFALTALQLRHIGPWSQHQPRGSMACGGRAKPGHVSPCCARWSAMAPHACCRASVNAITTRETDADETAGTATPSHDRRYTHGTHPEDSPAPTSYHPTAMERCGRPDPPDPNTADPGSDTPNHPGSTPADAPVATATYTPDQPSNLPPVSKRTVGGHGGGRVCVVTRPPTGGVAGRALADG